MRCGGFSHRSVIGHGHKRGYTEGATGRGSNFATLPMWGHRSNASVDSLAVTACSDPSGSGDGEARSERKHTPRFEPETSSGLAHKDRDPTRERNSFKGFHWRKHTHA